mgnify:CR=1 FL=1
MTPHHRGLLVHLFTATGAVFAMLAMLAAVDREWELMFLWLVVAFAVDGIDGPLARKYHVQTTAPEFDGVLLDLIIDYLTYVFIPAFALFKSDLLPGWTGWVAIIVITYASAMYFADSRMKTRDNSFSGFPGCWNMLVLVLFAVDIVDPLWRLLPRLGAERATPHWPISTSSCPRSTPRQRSSPIAGGAIASTPIRPWPCCATAASTRGAWTAACRNGARTGARS